MHKYELMVILDTSVEERNAEEVLSKFLAVVTKSGGTIENLNLWGTRKLAYTINKRTHGIYAVIDYISTVAASLELERQLKLSESVMRIKILCKQRDVQPDPVAKTTASEKTAKKTAQTKKQTSADTKSSAAKKSTKTAEKSTSAKSPTAKSTTAKTAVAKPSTAKKSTKATPKES